MGWPGELAEFRIRQHNRFNLSCESLESRHLLSATPALATDLSQITASPMLQVLPFASSGPTGMSPQQISGAYGVNDQVLRRHGRRRRPGQTIAIVTAYHDPEYRVRPGGVRQPVRDRRPAVFHASTNLGGSDRRTPAGPPETSLDVEWAHAMAPGANILLVEGASDNLYDLYDAVRLRQSQPGVSVVSMSWGTDEFYGESSMTLFTTPAAIPG